jgi:hypothetical protein
MRATATNKLKVTYDSNGAPFLLGIHGGSLTRGATTYDYDIKVLFLHGGSRSILPINYGGWVGLVPPAEPELLNRVGFCKLAARRERERERERLQLVTVFYHSLFSSRKFGVLFRKHSRLL